MAYFPDPAVESSDFDPDLGRANAGADTPKFTFDPLQDALATGQFAAAKTEAENALANDPEVADPLAHYDLLMVDTIDKSTAHITDPVQRKVFAQSAIDQAAAGRARIEAIAAERQKRAQLKQADETLTRLQAAALKAPDEPTLVDIIDNSRNLIGGLEHHGLLTPEEARQRSRSWVEDYAVQALKARPAKEQLETLRSLADGSADPETSMFALIPPEQRDRLQRQADRDATVQSILSTTDKSEK